MCCFLFRSRRSVFSVMVLSCGDGRNYFFFVWSGDCFRVSCGRIGKLRLRDIEDMGGFRYVFFIGVWVVGRFCF